MSVEPINIKSREAQVLLVDDNPGDVLLTQRALREANFKSNVTVATDGESAIAMLKNDGEYSNLPKPDLILLDLNLPRMSGHEVLDNIKNDAYLKYIPVIILSSSKSENDVLKSYNLYASAHIMKPMELEEIKNMVNALEQFFFVYAILPDKEDVIT